LNALFKRYRAGVGAYLEPIVREYNPFMLEGGQDEYRKMLELSAKMNVVGHACTEIGGFGYDERRHMIGSLFGACCFLADSFIDDFGEEACAYRELNPTVLMMKSAENRLSSEPAEPLD
jgi:hypothetical protein